MLFIVFTTMGTDISAKVRNNIEPMFETDTLMISLDTTYSDSPHKIFYIEYRNAGGQDLIIKKIETSCHCTTVEFDSTPLHKDKHNRLKVSVDMSMFSYGRYYGDVFVYTNVSENPVEIMFSGFYLRKENE